MSNYDKARRASRRRDTRRIAKKRLDDHLRVPHFGDRQVDCICDLADTYFAKRPGLGCAVCRSRRKGRPRENSGICTWGHRDYIYRRRAQVRELNHMIVLRYADPLGDEVARLCVPAI